MNEARNKNSAPVLVFAGDFKQATEFARGQGWSVAEWRYLIDARTLYGLREPVLYRVGTWYERPGRGEIDDLLRAIRAQEAGTAP